MEKVGEPAWDGAQICFVAFSKLAAQSGLFVEDDEEVHQCADQ